MTGAIDPPIDPPDGRPRAAPEPGDPPPATPRDAGGEARLRERSPDPEAEESVRAGTEDGALRARDESERAGE